MILKVNFIGIKKPSTAVRVNAEAGHVRTYKKDLDHPRHIIFVPDYGNFMRSRVIWKMVTGKEPGQAVDHANGNTLDDRFTNLIDGGYGWNNTNKKVKSASGLIGAVATPYGKWISCITVEGRKQYLGVFDSAEKASAAYLAARTELEKEIRSLAKG